MMTLDEFIRDFSIGFYRDSYMILNNVGINPRGKHLPAYKLLQFTEKHLYGTSRLSRWWMRFVFQRVFPYRYMARQACYQDALEIYHRDRMLDILEQALVIARQLRENEQ